MSSAGAFPAGSAAAPLVDRPQRRRRGPACELLPQRLRGLVDPAESAKRHRTHRRRVVRLVVGASRVAIGVGEDRPVDPRERLVVSPRLHEAAADGDPLVVQSAADAAELDELLHVSLRIGDRLEVPDDRAPHVPVRGERRMLGRRWGRQGIEIGAIPLPQRRKALLAQRFREVLDHPVPDRKVALGHELPDHLRELPPVARLDLRPRPTPEHDGVRAEGIEAGVRVVDPAHRPLGRGDDPLEQRLRFDRPPPGDHELEALEARREHRRKVLGDAVGRAGPPRLGEDRVDGCAKLDRVGLGIGRRLLCQPSRRTPHDRERYPPRRDRDPPGLRRALRNALLLSVSPYSVKMCARFGSARSGRSSEAVDAWPHSPSGLR